MISIFKNEAHILEEWINHYINEGVDIFYLIDNGSNDNYMDILDKYIKNNIVVLNVDSTRHQQTNLINKYYLEDAKKCDWVISVDLDEFVYARNGFKTIKDYLNSLNNINQVYIPWKMFGSSGFEMQPDNVIDNFIWRLKYNNQSIINGKCITKGNIINQLDIHQTYINTSDGIITSDGKEKYGDKNFIDISEDILLNSSLHLNHYAIQSLDWFKRIKMTRGDATSSTIDYIRNLDYFRAYDHNDKKDTELKNKNVNFDWITYLNKYEDLRNAGINTKDAAIEHWNEYGKKEGRTYI